MADAERLADALAARFERGDAADDLLRPLSGCVADIRGRAAVLGGELPDDARDALSRLLARIQATTAGGDAWLGRASDTRAEEAARSRIRRAYGLPAPGT